MTNTKTCLPLVLAVAALTQPTAAFAYLDPGTGSLILQGLLAAVAGALFTAKLYWFKVQAFWTKHFSRHAGDTVSNEENQTDRITKDDPPPTQ